MKKVIITWISSGLWKSLAQVFFDAWYKIIGLSRTQWADFIDWIQTDLTDENSVENACENIWKNHSDFECMIHCAGDGFWEAIDALEWQKTQKTFQLNVIAPIVMTSKLFEIIKHNKADIINIWATIGFKPYSFFSVYGTSKWALRGWTENLQLELKGTPCRVIGVHPGWIDTAGNDRRRGNIKELSGKDIGAWFMSSDDIAKFILQIYQLPKNMEISEVIINRK